jgi:beta-phosphoglucomutase-like phosphatase (HAD superfamily)
MIEGVLVDMDGVFFDSEHFICKAAIMMFRELGYNVNLREIGLSEDTFQAIISGHDVKRKKTFPDIYIKAAVSLGLKPGSCLVVEDAVSGIKAGKAAGCRCLGVTTSFDAEALNEADWVCDSLLNVPEGVLNW